MIESLKKEKLYNYCNSSIFKFNTTKELESLDEIIGQKRASQTIEFATQIRKDGYNIFAMGPTGSGKQTAVMNHIKQKAKEEPTPDDVCYVNNFADNRKPTIITLPPAKGSEFKNDIDELIDDLESNILLVFDSDDYKNQKEAINESYRLKENELFNILAQEAKNMGISFLKSTEGYGFAPINDKNEILTSEEYNGIDEDKKIKIQKSISFLQKRLQETLREISKLRKANQKEIKNLKKFVAQEVSKQLVEELRLKYSKNEKIQKFLLDIEEDVVQNVDDFLHQEAPSGFFAPPKIKSAKENPLFRKYRVNLFINRTEKGAPVIYEDNPTYQNLIGHIEHIAQFGTLLTDFSLIKAGTFHKANGGYLILDARKLLMQPYGWEGLKRVLRSKEIRIESLEQLLSLTRTTSLEPEPIKIDFKVVLIGERMLYYLLYRYDPEFKELFKAVADFEDDMQKDEENLMLYARVIATVAQKHEILPLCPSAVAKVIEYSSRLTEDSNKLSANIGKVTEILEEADFLTRKNKKEVIGKDEIQEAIENKKYRNNRINEKIQEMIEDGTIMIDVDGYAVGQINGLSVMSLGDFMFAKPTRITAKTRIGSGKIIDIEREVELGGSLHSKGVMILSSFLGARYAKDEPFSLNASLVFEQSYGSVDGDSASSAELYAILSSLADIPINQSFAVTGSVNQHGQIQAIGGVNEKIEGFFDICKIKGLNGKQGVIIPKANIKNLMLKEEVVTAVENNRFFIYAIETIDEGIELLTGKNAGKLLENGNFEEDSINALVEKKLQSYASKQQAKKSLITETIRD